MKQKETTMQKCLKENKSCLISLIIISVGIVAMVWLRQELLGNLVDSLAYPLMIFGCIYIFRKPLESKITSLLKVDTPLGKFDFKDLEKITDQSFDSVFNPVDKVSQENYTNLIYLYGILYFYYYYTGKKHFTEEDHAGHSKRIVNALNYLKEYDTEKYNDLAEYLKESGVDINIKENK